MGIAEKHFGGNKPPLNELLPQEFAELVREVTDEVERIKLRPAKVKDETDFAAVASLVTRARKLNTMLEDTRKGETDPMFTAQREVKGFFDNLIGQVNAVLKPHTDAADGYANAKAAEEKRKRDDEARKLREQEEAERKKAESGTGASAARAEGRAEQYAAKADKLEHGGGNAADAVRTKTAEGGSATARQKYDFTVEDYDAIDLNSLRDFMDRAAIDKAVRAKVRIQKGNTVIAGVKVFPVTKAHFR